jgi:hypothetical protein
MGSGASNLNEEQRALLTQGLTEAYTSCAADNLEDDIIQSTLIERYNALLQNFDTTQAIAAAAPTATPHYSLPKGKVKAKGGATRRRSFDVNVKKPVKISNPVTLNTSASETSVKTGQLEDGLTPAASDEAYYRAQSTDFCIDNWDSVSQQPFCNICQMAFKTVGFLDRHKNYSSIHAQNVVKENGDKPIQQQQLDLDLQKEVMTLAAERKDLEILQKQQEGVDYKLLYTGTKLYWRTQKSIDFNFYHHVLADVIEIVAFDPEKHKELNRVYLDYSIMMEWMSAKVKMGMIEREQQIAQIKQRDRFFSVTVEAMNEYEKELQRTTLTTFILQRLQIQSLTIENSNVTTGIAFVSLPVDHVDSAAVLTVLPAVLVPVNLTYRRRTTADDHKEAIKSLSIEHDAINSFINSAAAHANLSAGKAVSKASSFDIGVKAERIASIMHSFINLVTQRAKASASLKVVQRKWIKAISRVIRVRNVAATREMLSKIDTASLGSPTVRIRRTTALGAVGNKSKKVDSASSSMLLVSTLEDEALAERVLQRGIGDAAATEQNGEAGIAFSGFNNKRVASKAKAAIIN